MRTKLALNVSRKVSMATPGELGARLYTQCALRATKSASNCRYRRFNERGSNFTHQAVLLNRLSHYKKKQERMTAFEEVSFLRYNHMVNKILIIVSKSSLAQTEIDSKLQNNTVPTTTSWMHRARKCRIP